MCRENIITKIEEFTQHNYIELVPRGNEAITAALSIFPKGSAVLIPAEGGWIHYQKAPAKSGLKATEVECNEARIDLNDLHQKISSLRPAAFLYQNPGGYFAEQPMKEIYAVCSRNSCLVLMDVSGGIGTALCDGRHADILVGSFGKWKLVEARVGGFVSCKERKVWEKLKEKITPLNDGHALQKIDAALEQLPRRISQLRQLQQKVVSDLCGFELIYSKQGGGVVAAKYKNEKEKKEIIAYCRKENLPYTECPRYIRLNQPAISIEVKQMESKA